MGVLDFLRSKFSSAYAKRMDAAADQLAHALMLNRTLEIPASQSTDSDVMNAIFRLREKYPDVGFNMLQSKSIVLTRNLNVSKEAYETLDRANYFPDAKLPPELFMEMHQEFQRFNSRVDPKVAELEALEAQRAQDAMSVGAIGVAPVGSVSPEVAPAPPVSAPEPAAVIAPGPAK